MSRYCAACFGLGMYNARVEDEMKKFAEAQQYFCVFTSRKGKKRNSSSTYLFMPRSFFTAWIRQGPLFAQSYF